MNYRYILKLFPLLLIVVIASCSSHNTHVSISDSFKECEGKSITTINGEIPPGSLLPLQNTTTMLDTIDSEGKRLVVKKGIRKAGTRVGIHLHKYGGHTCVLSGEITDFIEGVETQKYPAGTCYYMPPNVFMSAANLGSEDAVLIDTFILPIGQPEITICEPGYP